MRRVLLALVGLALAAGGLALALHAPRDVATRDVALETDAQARVRAQVQACLDAHVRAGELLDARVRLLCEDTRSAPPLATAPPLDPPKPRPATPTPPSPSPVRRDPPPAATPTPIPSPTPAPAVPSSPPGSSPTRDPTPAPPRPSPSPIVAGPSPTPAAIPSPAPTESAIPSPSASATSAPTQPSPVLIAAPTIVDRAVDAVRSLFVVEERAPMPALDGTIFRAPSANAATPLPSSPRAQLVADLGRALNAQTAGGGAAPMGGGGGGGAPSAVGGGGAAVDDATNASGPHRDAPRDGATRAAADATPTGALGPAPCDRACERADAPEIGTRANGVRGDVAPVHVRAQHGATGLLGRAWEATRAWLAR